MTFEEFVRRDTARRRAGLVAAYGPDVGADATAEALAYGFEHWDRISGMDGTDGVGTAPRRHHRVTRHRSTSA